ncbi:MAG: hypothetical protein QM791_21655 [Ferruginibacter sp.]
MRKLPVFYTALFILQLVIAIICAPHSCEWGNSFYFFTGIFCGLAAAVIPFFQKQWQVFKRLYTGLLLLLLSVVLWCTQFMLLDFRILCGRLF